MNAPRSYRQPKQLEPHHDTRHVLRDLPSQRESVPYVISLPEYGISTFVYTWVDKSNIAGSIALAYGPGIGPEPIVEKADGIAVGDRDFDDWTVGPVTIQQDRNLRTARVRAHGRRIQLDLRFEALHDAYPYSSHPDGCPTWAATDRLEQAGSIVGQLIVDGKSYAVDTTCARDHSWGTRDWDIPQHWKWLHAQANRDTCVHFWEIQARGQTELRGYVLRDGEMAEVDVVHVDWTADDRLYQKSIRATVIDLAGRTTRVSGTYFAHFPMLPVPSCSLIEGAMQCDIDGTTGTGWTEFMWPTDYLQRLQNERARR